MKIKNLGVPLSFGGQPFPSLKVQRRRKNIGSCCCIGSQESTQAARERQICRQVIVFTIARKQKRSTEMQQKLLGFAAAFQLTKRYNVKKLFTSDFLADI